MSTIGKSILDIFLSELDPQRVLSKILVQLDINLIVKYNVSKFNSK